jgi:hypothetical protein
MLQTIHIFLASSAELKADRDEFRLFLSVENDRLHKTGIYLKLIQWEYFLDALSETRLQDQYNKAIAGSDLMVCLFNTKAGIYTIEEFEIAYKIFRETGKPLIWTYFKQAPPGAAGAEDASLEAFKTKIASLGHFYTRYNNIDNLKYQFKLQLEYALPRLTTTDSSNKTAYDIDELYKISQTAEKIYNIHQIDKAEFS